MSIASDEKIIQTTSKGWYAVLESNKKSGPLILTDKQIIIGDTNESIPLDDIEEIDIETRFEDFPKINILYGDKVKSLEFYRTSAWSKVGIAHSEISAYTAYWASMLTMAAFLFGQNYGKRKEVKSEDRNAWCTNCKKYISIPWTDKPVYKIFCPECGQKSMLSLSPEDRAKQPH